MKKILVGNFPLSSQTILSKNKMNLKFENTFTDLQYLSPAHFCCSYLAYPDKKVLKSNFRNKLSLMKSSGYIQRNRLWTTVFFICIYSFRRSLEKQYSKIYSIIIFIIIPCIFFMLQQYQRKNENILISIVNVMLRKRGTVLRLKGSKEVF